MMAKKADLTLTLNNFFRENFYQNSSQFAPTFTSQTRSVMQNRTFLVTFTYRFGKTSSGGKESKKIKNDDGRGGGR